MPVLGTAVVGEDLAPLSKTDATFAHTPRQPFRIPLLKGRATMFVSPRILSAIRTVYWGLLVAFVLALGLFLPRDSNAYQSWPCYGCYGCQPVPCCGPTEYRVGELQIFIVGQKRDAIEVYFKDNFFRFRILDDSTGEPLTSLHCRIDVIIAPDPSRHGTVAIRYGKRFERIVVFGWHKLQKEAPEFGDLFCAASNTKDLEFEGDFKVGAKDPMRYALSLDENYPVTLRWIRPAIVRIRHGKCGERALVLKLHGGDMGWVSLYSTDNVTRSGSNLRGAVSVFEVSSPFRNYW